MEMICDEVKKIKKREKGGMVAQCEGTAPRTDRHQRERGGNEKEEASNKKSTCFRLQMYFQFNSVPLRRLILL